MPHLRFGRDKRGYENTFVVHTGRRRGKLRSRILYWFRTPPGVRVGRSALDEDAIRLLEEFNPDVEFDWTRILKGQPEPQPEAPPRASAQRDRGQRRAEHVEPREARRPEPPKTHVAAEPEPSPEEVELQAVVHFQPDEEVAEPEREIAPSAALARLGSEGLQRLRARYAEVMARITERISDPQQQEQLKSTAERLNPDSWVTDEEVRRGLDDYEAIFEELRAVIGRPRKRRRRRRRDDAPNRGPQALTRGDLQDSGGTHGEELSSPETEIGFSAELLDRGDEEEG